MKHGRKEDLQEQAQSHLLQEAKRNDMLVEKWGATDVGYGLMDLANTNIHKARRVAKAIQMQEQHLKNLNETIISQNFQTRPENVLKVVRIGTANSHRGDIFTEVALSTVDDALYFVDMTYENAITDKDQSAAEKLYEKAYYTSAGTTGKKTQAGDDSTSNSVTVGITDILPYKVHVLVDGEFCAYDDGSESLTALSGNSATVTGGSVDYDTGVVVITSTNAIASSSTITIVYEWDSEDDLTGTNWPKVSLTVSKKRFQATPQPLGYTYTTMTELLLGSTGLGDAEDMLLGAVGDEHAKARDYKAIAFAKRVANYSGKYEFDTDFATAGEVSDKLHAQKILSVINDIGGDIYDSIKRGQVNKIVAGQQAVTYMQKHDLWMENQSANRIGVYLAGTLAGIEVYVCPADASLVAKNEMLLTYKNPNEGLDVGIAFGTLTEIAAALQYPTFYTDGNIAQISDSMLINKDFIKKLTLNNLPDYSA